MMGRDQTENSRRACALFALAITALLLAAGARASHANGWEHAAIPFETLLFALKFGPDETRARAAESLSYRGQVAAIPALLDVLSGAKPNHAVRRAVYGALGRLKDRRALDALYGCVEREAREELRGACASAIGEIAAPKSLRFLLTSYYREVNALVRHRIIDALGNFPDPTAVVWLRDRIEESSDPDLRARAIGALGRTGAREAAPALLAVLETAQSDDERTRAVLALSRLRDPAAAPRLSALSTETKNPNLRTAVAFALGLIKGDSAANALVGLLSDESIAVQVQAVKGLENLGQKDTAGALLAYHARIHAAVPRDPARDLAGATLYLEIESHVLRALIASDATAALPALLLSARKLEVEPVSQPALRAAEAVYERRRVALYGLGYTGAWRRASHLERNSIRG